MKKSALRKKYLALRQQISYEDISKMSKQITKYFFEFLENHPCHCVHVFLPMESKKEIDTWQIIHKLWKDFPQIKTATSQTNFENTTLDHFFIDTNTKLIRNAWGISEPLADAQACDPTQIDLVLVPLLIFDVQGHRVGYGKGFYDRFLATCSKKTHTIGLSLFEAISEIEGIETHDVPLKVVITPSKIKLFGEAE